MPEKYTTRETALRWCQQDDAREARPALTQMVRQLATEHQELCQCLRQVERDIALGKHKTAATRIAKIFTRIEE